MAVKKTYGKIIHEKNEGVWKITEAQPHVCIKIKAIFPKIAKWQKTPFTFVDSPESCNDLKWFMDRYPLEISEIDLARLKRGKNKFINNINELEAIMIPEYTPTEMILNDGKKARDYQIKGSELFLKCKRLLIGDEVGLGKTLIGIISAKKETIPAIVVVETHMPKQWKDAVEEFTNLKVHLIKGTAPYSLPPADIYVTKYSCLAGWTNFFQTGFFKMVVFDEVQQLRHAGTGKYNGAKALSESGEYVLGLSATPIYNYGEEIFNVLSAIKQGSLGRQEDFLREWTGYNGKVVEDPIALGTYLRENFLFLRRTRKEVGRELPPVNTIIHHVGYDDEEVKKADEIARQLAIKVKHGSFVERGQAARELDMFARHTTGVAKARGVAEYVKILLENNEPVILAGWHRDVYEIWLEQLKEYNPVMYTGSETPAQKEAAKQAFINRQTNLFIISLRSGIGLDGLQHHCKTVVIGELDWSPQVHRQLIGRADRDGQKEQVTAIYLVSDCGSDPLIINMLGLKSSQSHGIVDPLTAVPQQYSDESRIKLLAEMYLEKKKISV